MKSCRRCYAMWLLCVFSHVPPSLTPVETRRSSDGDRSFLCWRLFHHFMQICSPLERFASPPSPWFKLVFATDSSDLHFVFIKFRYTVKFQRALEGKIQLSRITRSACGTQVAVKHWNSRIGSCYIWPSRHHRILQHMYYKSQNAVLNQDRRVIEGHSYFKSNQI